jgi:hypothetical protein
LAIGSVLFVIGYYIGIIKLYKLFHMLS